MGWIILPRGIAGGRIPPYLQPFLSAETPADLYVAAEHSLAQVGARYFNFAAERRAKATADWLRFAATNVNAEWVEKYVSRNYVNLDPRVHHVRNHSTPLVWDHTTFLQARGRELYDEAASYGILGGITIPLRSPSGVAGFSAVFDDMKTFRDHMRTSLLQSRTVGVAYVVATFFYEGLSMNDPAQRTSRLTVRLSARQRDCLLFEAQGLTTQEAARAMRITERTVQFHWSEILRRLSARSRAQAVATAIMGGLVEP